MAFAQSNEQEQPRRPMQLRSTPDGKGVIVEFKPGMTLRDVLGTLLASTIGEDTKRAAETCVKQLIPIYERFFGIKLEEPKVVFSVATPSHDAAAWYDERDNTLHVCPLTTMILAKSKDDFNRVIGHELGHEIEINMIPKEVRDKTPFMVDKAIMEGFAEFIGFVGMLELGGIKYDVRTLPHIMLGEVRDKCRSMLADDFRRLHGGGPRNDKELNMREAALINEQVKVLLYVTSLLMISKAMVENPKMGLKELMVKGFTDPQNTAGINEIYEKFKDAKGPTKEDEIACALKVIAEDYASNAETEYNKESTLRSLLRVVRIVSYAAISNLVGPELQEVGSKIGSPSLHAVGTAVSLSYLPLIGADLAGGLLLSRSKRWRNNEIQRYMIKASMTRLSEIAREAKMLHSALDTNGVVHFTGGKELTVSGVPPRGESQ